MVNSKNIAFKVNRQPPTTGNSAAQPYGTVINCRQLKGRRKDGDDIKSQQVRLQNVGKQVPRPPKRRKVGNQDDGEATLPSCNRPVPGDAVSTTVRRPFPVQNPRTAPGEYRCGIRGKIKIEQDVNHVLIFVLPFLDPRQLFLLYNTIPMVHACVHRWPKIWKENRINNYGDDLPEPPSVISEFQFSHLMYGRGCMTPGCEKEARKTYWAFLRRWCRDCLKQKIMREHEVTNTLKPHCVRTSSNPVRTSSNAVEPLLKCLVGGREDSWRNYGGVAPAHMYKTIYLKSDVEKLRIELEAESAKHAETWADQSGPWLDSKDKASEIIRVFAHRMQQFEEGHRSRLSHDNDILKRTRRQYFVEKASELTPPITEEELVQLEAFKRTVAIPKAPRETSWRHLRPKLVNEVEILRNLRETTAGAPDVHARELKLPGLDEVLFPRLDETSLRRQQPIALNPYFNITNNGARRGPNAR